MTDRVVVFVDYQNVYREARRLYHDHSIDPHWYGQFDPLKLGKEIAADSPFDRELHEVRIYRGLPSSDRDPKGYGASRRQIEHWKSLDRVTVHARPLRYPWGWPNEHQPGAKPQEKGIDVALAIDMAVMAYNREYEVGVLFSVDTDLKPALESVQKLGQVSGGSPRAEVAAWSRSGVQCSRLSIGGARIFCHWLKESTYEYVRDNRDYAQPTQK